MNTDIDKYYTDRLYNASIILGQAVYLARGLSQEHQFVETQSSELQKKGDHGMTATMENGVLTITQQMTWIDTTMKSALEFSALLMQFSFIEALVNAISDCTLEHDKTKQILKDGEVTFLTETIQTYKRGKIGEEIKFFSLEEKLTYYPKLLAQLHGHEFTVNKDKYGEIFKQAKTARDNITHPRPDFRGRIDPKDLFAAAQVVYWYQGVVAELFDKYITNKHVLHQTETMAYGLLYNINKVCNNGDEKHIAVQKRRFEGELKKFKNAFVKPSTS